MSDKKDSKTWIIIGIVILVVAVYFLAKHQEFISSVLVRSGPLAPIVALLLYPLLAGTPITTDPLTLIMVATYGPLTAVFVAWIGNNMAAMVEYYLGTKLNEVANIEKNKQKMPFGLAKLKVDSVGFLIFGRMIPGYGSKIISILAGSGKVPLKRYLWTTALTNFLGAITLAYGWLGILGILKNLLKAFPL